MGESEQKRNDRNLDALILAASDVLIDEDVEYLNSIDVSKTVISPKLDRRIRRRIHRESRKESMAKLMSYTRRVAAVFLVICSISFVLCMSVEAIRTRIWGTILTWFDDHVEIDFVDSANSTTGITAYREPSYYPDGVTAEPDGKTAEQYVVAYKRNDKLVAMYGQTPLKGDFEKAHKDYEVEAVLINQTSGQIRQHKKGNDRVLLWHDGVYSYKIIGCADDFDKDTLIKMAESVATVEYTERPNVITDYKEPELRIKGSTKSVVTENEFDYIVIYNVPEVPDDFVMFFHQQIHSENGSFGVNNEHCKISEIDINGNVGRLFEYENGDTALAWADSEYVYSIFTFYGDIIGTEDVIEMARAMK